MALRSEIMQALLGAIGGPSKPNHDEVEAALMQLADATAAIIRVMPSGTRERLREKFDMQLATGLERQHGLPGDEE